MNPVESYSWLYENNIALADLVMFQNPRLTSNHCTIIKHSYPNLTCTFTLHMNNMIEKQKAWFRTLRLCALGDSLCRIFHKFANTCIIQICVYLISIIFPEFIHSSIHCPYIYSFIHSFIRSCMQSSIHSSIHSFIHSLIHSFIHSSSRSSIHLRIYSTIQSAKR